MHFVCIWRMLHGWCSCWNTKPTSLSFLFAARKTNLAFCILTQIAQLCFFLIWCSRPLNVVHFFVVCTLNALHTVCKQETKKIVSQMAAIRVSWARARAHTQVVNDSFTFGAFLCYFCVVICFMRMFQVVFRLFVKQQHPRLYNALCVSVRFAIEQLSKNKKQNKRRVYTQCTWNDVFFGVSVLVLGAVKNISPVSLCVALPYLRMQCTRKCFIYSLWFVFLLLFRCSFVL